jgi:hypothetical protein
MNGFGRLINKFGDSYTGNWLNNTANGKGTYEYYIGDYKYIGSWD